MENLVSYVCMRHSAGGDHDREAGREHDGGILMRCEHDAAATQRSWHWIGVDGGGSSMELAATL